MSFIARAYQSRGPFMLDERSTASTRRTPRPLISVRSPVARTRARRSDPISLFARTSWFMLAPHIGTILMVTGVITAVPVFQFFFPRVVLLRMSRITLDDPAALFFARHWGLVTLTIGALLFYAGAHPEARTAIVTAILVEKIGYAGLVFAHWNKLPGLRGSGVFDALCSVIYAAYLIGV